MWNYYSEEELKCLGLKAIGNNVLISKKASIFKPEKICIGNNVRIDDYCILSGELTIMDYTFLAAGVKVMGGSSKVLIHEFVGISYNTTIVGDTDDYSGEYLFIPTVKSEDRKVTGNLVEINRYSTIGANCTILPDVIIAEGCSFGAMSLINRSTDPWGIYYGVPCKRMKERKRDLVKLCGKYDYNNTI